MTIHLSTQNRTDGWEWSWTDWVGQFPGAVLVYLSIGVGAISLKNACTKRKAADGDLPKARWRITTRVRCKQDLSWIHPSSGWWCFDYAVSKNGGRCVTITVSLWWSECACMIKAILWLTGSRKLDHRWCALSPRKRNQSEWKIGFNTVTGYNAFCNITWQKRPYCDQVDAGEPSGLIASGR